MTDDIDIIGPGGPFVITSTSMWVLERITIEGVKIDVGIAIDMEKVTVTVGDWEKSYPLLGAEKK